MRFILFYSNYSNKAIIGYWMISLLNERLLRLITADCMTHDGYFKTGDVAMIDDKGFFHIVARKKT